jgi:hypothetical protein
MKILVQVIAIVIIGYLAELILPWYSIAFVAMVFGYLINSESNFLGGFAGVAILWGLKIWKITAVAATDLPARVAELFPVKETWILIVVTLFLGGLVGGFAAVAGASLRVKKKNKGYYYR